MPMRDVFYYGKKPNAHPREKHAIDLAHARNQCTTEHFWIINEYCDYTNFDWDWDFDFLPDEEVWTSEHNNVWPSQYQKDSGTWLCSIQDSEIIIYRADVEPLRRKNIKHDNWVVLDKINEFSFDFSWEPNPYDPPYIYKWGCKFYPAEIKHYVEYHVEGATNVKYMTDIVELYPEYDRWVEIQAVDKDTFDFSWRPDPREPAYIYTWGNKYISAELKPTLEYHCEGATERKYMDNSVIVLPEYDRWTELKSIDKNSFDFTWRPDPREPAFIYMFGNTQYLAEIMPTVEYRVPGATEYKFIEDESMRAKLLPNSTRFTHLENCDGIDYSWTPDPWSPPYIYAWGNQWNKPEDKISIQYVVEGATEYKYMESRAIRKPCMDNWEIPSYVIQNSFDFSWEPNPNDPPYIYQFATVHQKTGGPRYIVPGATAIKYVNTIKANVVAWRFTNWLIPGNVDQSSFDFSWHPDDTEPPYIYQFASTWSRTGGPKFTVEGATEVKYIDYSLAKVKQDMTYWTVPAGLDTTEFDYSWHPNIHDEPHIYQFGTQWQKTDGPTFTPPNCKVDTPTMYMDILKAKRVPDKTNWDIPDNILDFDYSWHPDSTEPAFIYQFPSTWDKIGGPRYVANGATDIKYMDYPIAKIKQNFNNWIIPPGFDKNVFDFSWHPDPNSPPYIYQFGTLLEDIHLQDGPKYVTPNNDGTVVFLKNILLSSESIQYPQYYIETTLDSLIEQHSDEIFWALRKNIDYTKFDFNWKPTKEQAFNINTFGSPESETTQTYLVNGKMYKEGYRDINFIENTKLDEIYLSKLFKKVDAFFIDKGNKESATRFEQLKLEFPSLQKTRYLNSWVDTIYRCINKSTTELCWILNSELDYTNFDFNYYPNPWQMSMVHVFGTQWSHWGTTFMVNKETFAEDTKYVKVIEHLNILNFVKTKRAIASNCLYDVYLIDYGNDGLDDMVSLIESKTKRENVNTIKYENDYLTTLKNMLYELGIKKDHYVWVCSSICDYSNFDFTYIVDPFSLEQLHVFPSDKQKFGDTFFINVNKLRILVEDLDKLENIEKINFNQHQKLKRLPAPSFVTEADTHLNFKKHTYNFPYAVFTTSDNCIAPDINDEPISMWSSESKNILITNMGGTRIVVPKEANNYVEKELYDYPYIAKATKMGQSKPLDIVFLSNGETGADENYEHLLNVTKGLKNRVVRVDGVNGRVAAYHAAAIASRTSWMFTVFAKLRVNSKFDFSWQPDRLQIPKHYIFYASNPVNGLVYGHQGLICYNKKLTLNNLGYGLDFTLDDEHEVIEINSGVALYNTDAYATWRTAFREVIKLKDQVVKNPQDKESASRLYTWLNVGYGDFSKWSNLGAADAEYYYEEVSGDYNKLNLSYEWAWLKDLFKQKYGSKSDHF
jgi:hypothetical protein